MQRPLNPIVRLVARRTMQAIPLLLVTITINFIIIWSAPGDPTHVLLGETANEEFVQAMRAKFGLDKPLYVQYVTYVSHVVQGDLGYSLLKSQSVTSLILGRFPATLLLISTSMFIAIVLGILLGVAASKRPYSLVDNLASGISVFGVSTPTFWFGQMLLIVFAIYVGLFPVAGMTTAKAELMGLEYLIDVMHHLALPACALAAFHLGFVTRLTRASMLEVLGQDFIVTAYSKGLNDRTVTYKHALRNALLPVTTYTGVSFAILFAGAVLIETVFSWPGMGRLLYDSLRMRDYPVVLGIFVVVSLMVTISNILVDVIYGVLDPRIRTG